MNKLILSGLVSSALLLSACGETPTDTATTIEAQPVSDTGTEEVVVEQVEAPEMEVVEVDAKTLFTDYSANEVKADGIYKGKTLKVTGVIDSIESGMMDEAMLMLRTANEYENVMATVDEAEKAKAAELTKGETVTVQCLSDGEIMGSPMLSSCRIL